MGWPNQTSGVRWDLFLALNYLLFLLITWRTGQNVKNPSLLMTEKIRGRICCGEDIVTPQKEYRKME